MTQTIKAIETRYKGYRFRSRLEARWAVFFEALDIEWSYEPDGFELPSGARYLPDFLLHARPGFPHIYLEVKPQTAIPKAARDRLSEFGQTIANGDVDSGFVVVRGDPLSLDAFMFGRFAGEARRLIPNAPELVAFWSGVSVLTSDDVQRVADAAIAARSARFEFGQCGAPA